MEKNAFALPCEIFSGRWKYGHCQGIALDAKHEYIYYSFTTALVKTDLQGNLIGSCVGLMGHLGCIAFNEADGRVYGSLEYKNDVIGRGILRNIGSDAKLQDAFYIVMFDVDKIDRIDMDACGDGVMKSVYLKEVLDDFKATVECGGKLVEHRHGCSGIDGTTFGPMPGSDDGKKYLFVSYGVYNDVERTDNDCQVILCYDTEDWAQYERPLSQQDMHACGPEKPLHKFFVYTGNTNWGVQNLEYDAHCKGYMMAVYVGKKPQFPNNPMYIIDAEKAPVVVDGKEMLTLMQAGEPHESGVYSWTFPHGSTGLYAFGDGRYYVSEHDRTEEGYSTTVKLYQWDGQNPLTPLVR